MQIPQGGHGPKVGLHAASTNPSAFAPVPARPDSADRNVGGVEIVGGHADQLTSIAARLKDVPDTRDEIVSRAREQIEQGHYLTRDAAERTAASYLGK